MKYFNLLPSLFAILAITANCNAQLTLQECYQSAEENYPLIRQRDLIEKARVYSLRNAALGYLPQVVLNGQATYQSDVTRVPAIPGQDAQFPTLSKDQFKVYADVVAPIYDGGLIKNQKRIVDVNAQVEQQALAVELYQIKDRINNLYFGILLIDGQLVQHQYLLHDIELGLNKTNAAIMNGAALKSSADLLRAELLKAQQAGIELKATRSAYLSILQLMIDQPLDDKTTLLMPVAPPVVVEINRPELRLFDVQSSLIDVQDEMINARLRPKLSAFVQAGYGKPGLNMLDTKTDSYYLTGIKFNWTINQFYSAKTDREVLNIHRKKINVQRETFVFNNRYEVRQEEAEVSKLQQLANADEEIIILRTNIKQRSSIQLENGVIDSNDYLREVNAEHQARQSKVIHEIQLLLAQYTLATTTGR
jgi:outer membrane protein TolC